MSSAIVLGALSFVVVGGLVYYYITKSETDDAPFDKNTLIEEHEREPVSEVSSIDLLIFLGKNKEKEQKKEK